MTDAGADLRNVDLSYIDLSGVDFREADLSGSILHCTNLYEANLRNVNLRGADMSFVQAAYATFAGADLRETDFRAAKLSHAVFERADLRNAKFNKITDIREAWFESACLDDVDGLDSACLIVCPETGSFVGWKKAKLITKNQDSGFNEVGSVIVKLRILEGAKRSSATSRKCRCSAAMVEEIQTLDGLRINSNSSTIFCCSWREPEFVYETGKIVSVSDFDDNRWNECSTGIHFFITREEAVNY